ncbi:MAG: hypothetical protein ACTHNU_03965 [Gaiellales bacterium]
MPRVVMTITGTAVGASGEEDAFADLVRVTIGHVAEHARPTIRVGADDQVAIEVTVDRRVQSDVGEALDRLLADASISSSVIGEDREDAAESAAAEQDPEVDASGPSATSMDT